MTEAKHTPGPWHWVNSKTDEPFDFTDEWDGVGCPSLRTVKEEKRGHFVLPEFILDADPDYILEKEADARLIAAAPDLLEALESLLDTVEHLDITEGVCCCGDDMANHANPMDCGHAPVDAGEYYHGQTIKAARAAIAKAKGGKG